MTGLPRMITRAVLLLSAIAPCAWPSAARAQSVELITRTVVPANERPTLRLQVRQALRALFVEVKGDRGGRVAARFGALAAGAEKIVTWRQAASEERYAGQVTVKGEGEEAETIPIEFDAVVGTPLELRIDKGRTDVQGGVIVLSLSPRAAARADLKLLGEDGAVLAEQAAPLPEAPAGTPVELRFEPPAAAVARADVVAHDRWGFFAGVGLIPWHVEFDEQVHFATDSAVIEPGERAKLDANHARVVELARRYRHIGDIKLFIAGHTDTQGSPEHNRKLSTARARAIALYFKPRGLPLPTFWAGFGEEAPKVPTADQTDEPRNRRVEYILAVDPPSRRAAAWQPVP